MQDDEIPLTGGNVNAVVRIGETVRRPVGPQSATIHTYLRHLVAVGFMSAPRFLGIDAQGREILSFIAGETPDPHMLWADDVAYQKMARKLRHLHNASASFVGLGKGWAYRYPDPARHEVICHNDLGPYNLIFRRRQPVGIIDFDLCGPGPRLRDLAYLAYWMVPLGAGEMAPFTKVDLDAGSPRLQALCQAYRDTDARGLPDMMAEVLHHMGDPQAVAAMIGTAAAARLEQGGHFAHWQHEAEAFEGIKARVARALRG